MPFPEALNLVVEDRTKSGAENAPLSVYFPTASHVGDRSVTP